VELVDDPGAETKYPVEDPNVCLDLFVDMDQLRLIAAVSVLDCRLCEQTVLR
jgi:hypothetical protein